MTTVPSPHAIPDPPDPLPGSAPPSFTTPTSPASTGTPIPDEVTSWLRANAIPFNTSQPGTDYSDLMPLKHIVGDARLVLLGEATHGTHEFFAMKHRLLEFLVKEMGFTVFGIEDTWAGAEVINDYVHGGSSHAGSGTAEAAHRMLNYWIWRTTEVLDIIKWMRTYNDNPANMRKVRFTGFDMQDPGGPAEHVLNYLRKVDPGQVDNVARLYSCIGSLRPDPMGYRELPQEKRAECRNNLEKVHSLLQERQNEYEELSHGQEFASALHAARIMLQAEDHYDQYAEQDRPQVRDRYMADNAAWLLKHADPGPDAKIVLWAHNMHVSKQVLPAKGSPYSPYPWTPMGHYLHERFGHQVFSVGFTFGHGTFTAITMRDHEPVGLEPQDAGQPPVDSYEHYLASAGIPRMLLDLRSIRSSRPSRPGSPGPSPTSPETDWLIGPRLLRSIGPVYDSSVPEHWFEEVRLAEAFDLLIYFQEAKASGVLPP